jgi:glucosylceramidase
MKRSTLLITILLFSILSCVQKKNVEWISSTSSQQWIEQTGLTTEALTDRFDVEIQLDKPLQTIDGFGACFNELGWNSLQLLSENDRETIFNELFAPGVGANFSICRMPLAANDFSVDWYSFNESDQDFEMKNFSIDHDMKTLVPFIQNALKYNPSLKLWASPWSPPSWMKYNKHYAMKMSKKINNGLKPEQEGTENQDMFIQEDKYFKAYSLYFEKFIQAYKDQGIQIGMVMPQNEFKAAQIFPSCTWTSAGLSRFIGYLGPQMAANNVDLFFGTMNSGIEALADSALTNQQVNQYIKGIGLQWAGKDAIAGLHGRYPELTIYQTEQECGDGKNSWDYCVYSWGLMNHYLSNGTNAYMYWNTSLKQGGISTWGWEQNSLVSVDELTKTYKFNYEYYLMKHFSHYVLPGATRLQTSKYANVLAFVNQDKSIALVLYNDSKQDKTMRIKVGDKMISPLLKGDSFNTFLIK